jgi:hypothetical protein
MAKVKGNLVLGELSGKLGNLVVRQVGGKSVVQAAPVRQAPATAGELKNQQAFREAQAYARQSRMDPALWGIYMAEAKRRGGTSNPYAVAISDYRLAPVLHELKLLPDSQTGGQKLRIHATDNVLVTQIAVKIIKADRSLNATGLATRETDSDWWQFPFPAGLTGLNTAEVTVSDLAGNMVNGKLEINPILKNPSFKQV